MKNKEKDVDFTEENFKKQFTQISRERRPAITQNIGDRKNRITIYLDSNVVDFFKRRAKTSQIGYQTLINNALKILVDNELSFESKLNLKKDLLEDEIFLRELKERLAA